MPVPAWSANNVRVYVLGSEPPPVFWTNFVLSVRRRRNAHPQGLQGDSRLPEHAALGGMLRVGNEFMTERNADGEVQRAGEFVTMKRALRWRIPTYVYDPRDTLVRGSLLARPR